MIRERGRKGREGKEGEGRGEDGGRGRGKREGGGEARGYMEKRTHERESYDGLKTSRHFVGRHFGGFAGKAIL